jgi:dTDP-4-dehydrorhamnose reductase
MSIYDRILVTGGHGMLAHAFRHLLMDRNLPFVAPPRAELDVTDAGSLARAFKEHRPTLVLNCAAHTKVDLCEEQEGLANAINGTAVGTLATLAKEHGARLVHYSTDFVFDGSSTVPYKPTDPPNPLSAYGRSKLLGERALRRVDPPAGWLILRTAWVYGPGGNCFPRTMVNAARAGKPLRVVCDQVGTPTYTRDLAAATLDLLEAGATGLLHYTNAGQTNWCDFARAALAEFGIDHPVEAIASADWQKLRPRSSRRPAYSVLDTSDYARLTGKSPRPWRDALRDYAQVSG